MGASRFACSPKFFMSAPITTVLFNSWPNRSLLARRLLSPRPKVLTVFGTRPEAIKLAPVIHELERRPFSVETVCVATSQHTDLLAPFVRLFNIRADYDLCAMRSNQRPDELRTRLVAALDPILTREDPDMVLVQGDTTTALSGALAAFARGIAVGHIEAGLRSGNLHSPFPEEMNRRLITQLATYHFAATSFNRTTLLEEGVSSEAIFVTGNTVVDSLKTIMSRAQPTPALTSVLEATRGLRRIVLTTHRRESFGRLMTQNLRVLRRCVEAHPDVALVFPVHPNPAVVRAARLLESHPRIHLIEPLGSEDFIQLMSNAWLLVSDSGGIQEEAPTLGRPLLVLRENTERHEALQSGVARLVGGSPERLALLLEEALCEGSWATRVAEIENPFGRGTSGLAIARIVLELLNAGTDADAFAASPVLVPCES